MVYNFLIKWIQWTLLNIILSHFLFIF
jgi:hypothetical protein